MQRRRLTQASSSVDKDVWIVEKLKSDPMLLNRFLHLRDRPSTDPEAAAHDEDEEDKLPVPASSSKQAGKWEIKVCIHAIGGAPNGSRQTRGGTTQR